MSSVASGEDFSWHEQYIGKYICIDGVPRLVDSETGDLLGPIVPTASMQDIGAPYLYEFESSDGEGSQIYHVGGEVPVGLGQYSDDVEANSEGVSISGEDCNPDDAFRVLGGPARQREHMLWAEQQERILSWSLDQAENDFECDWAEGAVAAAGDNTDGAGASTSHHTERAAEAAGGDVAEGAVALAGPSSNAVQHGPVQNPIGRLNEYANKNKFPYPTYTYFRRNRRKSEVHCRFLEFSVVGVQRNKKLAKRNAAQYMLYQLGKCKILQKSVAAPL